MIDKGKKLRILPQSSRSNTQRKIDSHTRALVIGEKTYSLQYQSGPSFLDTGKTYQLFMEVRVEDSGNPNEVEIYTLKRYPINQADAIAQKIIVNKMTREARSLDDFQTLRDLVSAFYDSKKQDTLTDLTLHAAAWGESSDFDLMNMYFKYFRG